MGADVMATAFGARGHNVFLSHASADKAAFVDELYAWLSTTAKVSVWYDRNLYGAAAGELSHALGDSQSALFVVSKSSVASEWVNQEFECALAEKQADPNFRIASIRIDETTPHSFLRTYTHINALNGVLEPRSAALVLEALFGTADPAGGRPVYFSRGTRRPDKAANDVLLEVVRGMGCRLVCDAPDQPHMSNQRLEKIISGCSGLVALLPLRNDGATSPYVVSEIKLAQALGKPILVLCREGVKSADWPFDAFVFTDDLIAAGKEGLEDAMADQLDRFSGALRAPDRGEHVFMGHSFADSSKEMFLPVQRLISRLVGLPVKAGAGLTGRGAQEKIVKLIQTAEFNLIDITNNGANISPEKFNYGLNSSIEAGAALGANRPLYITCQGKPRTPPYMFRDIEVQYYESELDLVGIVKRITHAHRRQVIR